MIFERLTFNNRIYRGILWTGVIKNIGKVTPGMTRESDWHPLEWEWGK